MSRPKAKLLALVALAASLTCASANAAGTDAQDGGNKVQGSAQITASVTADPNYAPYPACESVLRMKPGACDPDQPVQLDITGDADARIKSDRVQAALDEVPGLDGGLEWDPDRKVLRIRLVGPIDGSSPAVERAKAAAKTAGGGLSLEFQSVKYSRAELLGLARQLMPTQKEWAAGLPPASGGWDPEKNRVVLLVQDNTGQTAAWTERVKALQDERIVLEFYTPKPGVSDFIQQVSRLDDSEPWFSGDWLIRQPDFVIMLRGLVDVGGGWLGRGVGVGV